MDMQRKADAVYTPNPERVEKIVEAALLGMSELLRYMPEATSADVISACMTLAAKGILITLETSANPEHLEMNRKSVQDAVYKLLMLTTEGEAPRG